MIHLYLFQFADSEDVVIERLQQDQTLPLHSAKIQLGDVPETILLELFEPLINATVSSIYTSKPLPIALDKTATLDSLTTPTFTSGYKCALVHFNDLTITYNGATHTVPLLSQTANWNGLNLTFADTSNSKGLLTTFYLQYFNIIRDNHTLEANIWLNTLDTIQEEFRQLVFTDNDFWILLWLRQNVATPSDGTIKMVRYSALKAPIPMVFGLVEHRLILGY